jgi:hypothetical protein
MAQTRMNTGLRDASGLRRCARRAQARRATMTNFDAARARRTRLNDGQTGAQNFFA